MSTSQLLFSHKVTSDSATPMTAAKQAFLSFTISQSLLKLMPIESVMPSNHLILCCPFLFLPSILPSIRVFFNESALLIRGPKCWSFNMSHPKEYPRMIPFGVDWFDFLAVQESSPTPQPKSINSLALSLCYSPTLTFMHECWKNHVALTT